MGYIWQMCVHGEKGICSLNDKACIGTDSCSEYTYKSKPNRIDNIGQNGPTGEHYLVEKIARAICGEQYADQLLGGRMVGKKRWETHITQAMRVMEVIDGRNDM